MIHATRIPLFAALSLLGVSAASAQTFMSDWPQPDDYVSAIVLDDVNNVVYIAGSFENVDGQARNGVAAIDATNGTLLPWNPAFGNGGVGCMATDGTRLYVGGSFDQVNGTTRNALAAFDLPAGTLNTTWNPNVGGDVWDMVLDGTTLYFSGQIYLVQGQPRDNIAAVSTTSYGSPTAFDVGYCDQIIFALAKNASTVYAGGEFDQIGGESRHYVAAVNPISGDATAWNPGAGDWVYAVAVSGNTVYVGGHLGNSGGVYRTGIVAVDATTGQGTDWNAQSNDWVDAIAVNGNTVYIGGRFTEIGGQDRNGFAGVDATTGLASAWDPNLSYGPNDLQIGAILVAPPYLLVGGNFTEVGGAPHTHLAAFNGIASGVEEAGSVQRLPASPNPCEGVLHLNFTDPNARVIEVVNTLGELVRSMPFHPQLDLGALPAGTYSITVRDAAGSALARTLVVRS